MAENNIKIGGRLHAITVEGVVAGADEILDDNKDKKQSEINAEVDASIAELREGLADAGKVDDVKVNGVSVRDEETKEANINITASVVEDDTPGTPTANATMQDGNINIEFAHVKGIQGDKGDPGDSVIVGEGDLPLSQVVNEDSNKAITPEAVYKELTNINKSDESAQEISDGKYIKDDGGVSAYLESRKTGVTGYIDCANAISIEVSVVVLTTSPTQYLAFYDANKNFKSAIPREQGESEGTVRRTYQVPANAAYFRTTYWNAANRETYGAFYCEVVFEKQNKFEKINGQIDGLGASIIGIETSISDVNDNVNALDKEISKKEITGYSEIDVSLVDKIESDGCAINFETGGIYSSPNYNHTDYIDISRYSRIKYGQGTKTAASTKLGIAFYDAEKAFIPGSGIPAFVAESIPSEYIEHIVNVIEGAVYVRLSVFSDPEAESQYLHGFEAIYQKESKISPLIEDVDEISKQVFEKKKTDETEHPLDVLVRQSGRIINYRNGISHQSDVYDASDFINISEYDAIIYSRPESSNANTALGMAFYDFNQSAIGGQQAKIVEEASGYVPERVSVPSGACYMRISINKDANWGVPYVIGIKYTYQKVSRIKTGSDFSNKLLLTQQDIVELNVINSDGSFSAMSNMGCTDFICCEGASSLDYSRVVGVLGAGLAFYDETKTYIPDSYVNSESGDSGMALHTIDIPEGAKYFRASGWDYANSKSYGEFFASLVSKDVVDNGKRVSNGESTFFSVVYNAAIDDLSKPDFGETPEGEEEFIPNPCQEENYVCTTGVVLLPPDYSPIGKPCRVIINFHGWSHYVNYKQWGAPGDNYRGFMLQKQRWANAGYAVIDVNHKDSAQKGSYSGLGSIQDDECYRKAFEWVKNNYNVEDTCFIVCGSAGGPNGINACYNWPDVRAGVWLDTWVDVSEHAYVNSCGRYYYGYSGSYDGTKVGTRNPITKIISIAGDNYLVAPKCPIKIYPLNQNVGFLKPFVDLMEAGKVIGGDYYIRKCKNSGIGHSELVSGGDGSDPRSEVVDEEIINFLNQH